MPQIRPTAFDFDTERRHALGCASFRMEEIQMTMSERSSAVKRSWVPSDKRHECLDLFEKGYGYKKTAREAGLNMYTVREYRRRYASGDTAWAFRFSDDAG